MIHLKSNLIICALLFVMVLTRALSLEFTDLIDPTEARYATVATEMALTGDWITPKLPTSEGLVAYMGKPPLHFWLTAFTYKIFEIEEWTSRLPSLIAALFSMFFVFRFAKENWNYEKALSAILILFSSAMFYFLAGASVTDTTLTACVTASTVCLYSFLWRDSSKTLDSSLAAIFASLGFMCKGPVAIVLIGMPFLLYSLITRDASKLKRIEWVRSLIIFLLIVTPWFLVSEYYTPGTIKYFVWNENIARYLFRDYGDLYGTGHEEFHGMSWLMLFAGFAPWTFVPFIALFKSGFSGAWKWINADQARLFSFCWAIGAAIFFTFVRQLHGMYLLPALPGAALLTAEICSCVGKKYNYLSYSKIALRVFLIISLGITIAGCLLAFSWNGFLVAISSILLGLISYTHYNRISESLRPIIIVSILFCSTYLTVIGSLSEYIGGRRSAEQMIAEIADLGIQRVGVVSRNSYSHYWTARAWENELSSKVLIDYKDSQNNNYLENDYLLIKKGNNDVLTKVSNKFDAILDKGDWKLFKRKIA